MFKIENVSIVRTRSKGSPVADALTTAITSLKPGQSFKVKKKGQLNVARQIAKDLGIDGVTTSTTNGEWRVGMKAD